MFSKNLKMSSVFSQKNSMFSKNKRQRFPMFLAKKSLCPQKSYRFPMFLAKKTVCDIFHKKDGKSLTFLGQSMAKKIGNL